jgi:serine protease Do
LNLGTSGGALINLKGEMVGLTTALGALEGYERSAGFAIPVDDMFLRTIEVLKTGRKAEFGFLGVSPEDLSDSMRRRGQHGARVTHVVPGTPAATARIREGDVITHVNGQRIYDRDSLMLQLGRQAAGSQIHLTVQRGAALGQRGHMLQASVELSKKHILSSRSPYSQIEDPRWRGMQVDFATALPQIYLRQIFQHSMPEGCLGVIDVHRDSPAWKAGFRPATLITHVDGTRVTSPDEFFAAVEGKAAEVRIRTQGRPSAEIVVPP